MAVKTKTITQREEEKAFKIPWCTIINKLKDKYSLPVERPKVFSDDEENKFVGNIIAMSDYGFPILNRSSFHYKILFR